MDYNQIPNGQAPNGQMPNTQPPYTQAPYNQMPNTQPPYTQAPYNQMPNTQPPYTQPTYAQAAYAQPQSTKASFSVLKLIGLLIAAAGLAYKVIFNVIYFDTISGWWQGSISMYFVLYFTSIMTIVSAFTRKTASIVLSIVMLCISLLFLAVDGLVFLGVVAGLSNYTLLEIGIAPLVNLLNFIASVLILIGAARSKR